MDYYEKLSVELIMLNNPFLNDIRHLIEDEKQGLSIYQIIHKLSFNAFSIWSENADLKLYQQNFLVMNALFQLRDAFEDMHLEISPLNIRLVKIVPSHKSNKLSIHSEDELANYYLDWNNYNQTTASDVRKLINAFWQELQNDDLDSAYQALGIQKQSNWKEVKAQYQRLANRHHPDKGGNDKAFARIQQAYQAIKKRTFF